jgi:hypothetical protein
MITGKDIKEMIGMVIFTLLIFNAPELIYKYGSTMKGCF